MKGWDNCPRCGGTGFAGGLLLCNDEQPRERRYIEESWLVYERMVVPQGAGPDQRRDTRDAFFAGALSLMAHAHERSEHGGRYDPRRHEAHGGARPRARTPRRDGARARRRSPQAERSAAVRTRAEWTEQIIEDVRDLWRHMDETDSAPRSASHAAGMVKVGREHHPRRDRVAHARRRNGAGRAPAHHGAGGVHRGGRQEGGGEEGAAS